MMADKTETNTHADTVTVSEAAKSLGMTLPRLQRLLKRPEFAGHVSQGARHTRTGTRTVTLVSVSALEGLRRWEGEQKHEQFGQNRYHSGGAEAGGLPAIIYQQRIRDLEAANAELRADKGRLYGLLEAAQANLGREQALRSLPPPVPETDVDARHASAKDLQGAQEAAGGPETGAGEKDGAEVTPGRRRGLWARLWGRARD